jgi:putative thioredoxin
MTAVPTIIDVDEPDFEARVIEASRERPVVVDFWAGWCQPCHMLSPILERLADEHGGRFVLAKVDVDANPNLSARYRVQGIPAVKGFRNGEVVSEFVGAQPEEIVRRFLDRLLPTEADQMAATAGEAGSPEEAEAAFRAALAEDPSHPRAAAGLASLLLERGDVDEARTVLAAASPAPEVVRAQALLDLHAAGAEDGELGAAARAALDGDHGHALDRWLWMVGQDGDRDRARELMLDVFEVLGDDHPLTLEYRPRLAAALF